MTDFAQLYERYARDVYRFALYLSGSPTLAEDIASETFVRIFVHKDDIHAATVKAYLEQDDRKEKSDEGRPLVQRAIERFGT